MTTYFDTTVMGGIPVEVAYEVSKYDDRDIGSYGRGEVCEVWIESPKSNDWIYKSPRFCEDTLWEEARDHNAC